MPKKFYICREFEFDAAHMTRMPYKEPCKELHGHTYRLEVYVTGDMQEDNMVVDYGIIKEIVTENIISRLDHSMLNDLFPDPTTEVLCDWIFDEMKKLLEERNLSCSLYAVKLWEGRGKWAEVRDA